MRIKLIEDLPMATSAELYQLSWVIEQLLADPRRIVQVHAQMERRKSVYTHGAGLAGAGVQGGFPAAIFRYTATTTATTSERPALSVA